MRALHFDTRIGTASMRGGARLTEDEVREVSTVRVYPKHARLRRHVPIRRLRRQPRAHADGCADCHQRQADDLMGGEAGLVAPRAGAEELREDDPQHQLRA